ncbi:MAG: isoaspartyl peptidase/L-asparaginase [Microscillaceae bacterium]|nr:isoaspartyl peptidase/L-asparaginase [Microscillaceae bacterium]MDW8460092.1 isoaspartyl peptidase/L-asparaginase [Cytophagales bacterium]
MNYLFAQYQPVIVIHGGAGTIRKADMPPEKEKEVHEALAKALRIGYQTLENGGTSLDAVEQTIIFLENHPLFNAGVGSVLNNKAQPELDASIMNGATLEAGAVAGVSRIKQPISAAKLVMQKSPHVFMIGKGAEQFAKEQGLEMVKPNYFITPEQINQLKKLQKRLKDQKKNQKASLSPNQEIGKFGTVGCVALDKAGNLAAGTSTGGMINKRYGRVGDAPIIGAGTYADNNSCAVSATGHGEYFIRANVAFRIAALKTMQNLSLQQAAQQALDLVQKLGGSGGVIALDREGNIAMPFNTDGMYRGYIDKNKRMETLLYK